MPTTVTVAQALEQRKKTCFKPFSGVLVLGPCLQIEFWVAL